MSRPQPPTIVTTQPPVLEAPILPNAQRANLSSGGGDHLSPTPEDHRRHSHTASDASDRGLLSPSSPTSTAYSSHTNGMSDVPLTGGGTARRVTNDIAWASDAEVKRNGRSAHSESKRGDLQQQQGTEMTDVSHGTSIMGKVRNLFRRHKENQDSADADDADELPNPAQAHIDPSKDTTDPTPFFQKPLVLASLVDPKSLTDLEAMGGVEGLLHGLGVDPSRGLTNAGTPQGAVVEAGSKSGGRTQAPGMAERSLQAQYQASMEDRLRVYGKNFLPQKKTKSLLQLMWMALQDKVLIILLIAALISLALGIYQAVGTPDHIVITPDCPEGCVEPKVDWIEGLAILIAVALVVCVGAVNDYNKELQFKKLNEKKEDRQINVIRGGSRMSINTKDLCVGDICTLEPGEILCCDGVYLSGHSVKCDESGATGESDLIKKFTYDECIAERDAAAPGQKLKRDCFLLSGAKIDDGVGEYVVIALGPNSFNGRIMMSLRGESESTPLQLKLNALAEFIAKAGALAGGTLFAVLMIKFFVQLKTDPARTAAEKGQAFVQILIISVTVIVVAVPEGLPLAVTLALAFATRRMVKENLLVRILASCETMANATIVATDKTGTLTTNQMTVVALTLGLRRHGDSRKNAPVTERAANHTSFDLMEMDTAVPEPVRTLLRDAIALNSTAYEDVDAETGKATFIGSKTETALLGMGKDLGWTSSKELREQADIAQVFPFSSEAKMMGVIVRSPSGSCRLHVKGASEIVLRLCTTYLDFEDTDVTSENALNHAELTKQDRAEMNATITHYAVQSLRTICVGFVDLPQWPPAGAAAVEDITLQDIAKDLTLLATTGIQDPVRPGVAAAIADCATAGVRVIMVTGDNETTADHISRECGISPKEGGVIIKGPDFRKLTHGQRLELVPRLNVMARSSPEDKRLLVETAKELDNIVAVTGDGSNDAPALKLANVGFAMGIAGTEIAKEAADVIVLDDNFTSIVTALIWGRCVNDAVKRFLQFQISVNITAVVITFVSAVASSSEDSVLSAVQLLWVNLIMDTFAALALATDPATRSSLNRRPEKRGMPLLSPDMWKMIIIQALYQIIVCFVLHFAGLRILGLESTVATEAELSSLVFNAFVFCQIFNQINCRRLDRKLNIFEGFWKNYYFMVIFCIMVGGQILIVEVGGDAFQVVRLNGRDWGITLVIGALTLPLGVIVRLLPTAPFARLMIKMHLYPDPDALPRAAVVWDDEKYQYNDALTKAKNDLGLYSSIRGGRINAATNLLKRRSSRKSMKEKNVTTKGLLTIVPSLIVGSVGAGAGFLSPIEPSKGGSDFKK